MPAKRIVVGYDGSQGANSALRWALVEAVGTRAEIELVFARARLDLGGERDNGPLPAAVAEIRAEFPHVPVISSVRPGSAVTVLCDRSLDADLLVVGGRSHGAFADVLLGSVAAAVAARAPCTVVVTSGLQPLAPAGHVLLGLAQSPGADLATAFAFSHAAARGLPLRAIRAWIPPPDGCIGSPDADPDGSAVAELAIIRRQLSAWRERYPWVPMDIAVVPGPPHRVLVEAARPAGLVVLGAHGHGHLHGQWLNSVTRHVLHHSGATVAIVRRARRRFPFGARPTGMCRQGGPGAHDEWQTGDRRYLAEGSMAALATPPADTTTELLAACTPALRLHDPTGKLNIQQSLTQAIYTTQRDMTRPHLMPCRSAAVVPPLVLQQEIRFRVR